jgi:cellulose/xylan binding protein with CBM9 domain
MHHNTNRQQPDQKGQMALALALGFSLLFSAPLSAQESAIGDYSTFVPTTKALYIDKSEAPNIDGKLDDAIWQQATAITAFTQVQPNEGAAPSEPITAYIVYDDENIYFGVYLYDSKAEEIRTETLRRDPGIDFNDGLRIVLDPFQTGRDSYYFGINTGGAKLDGLSENNRSFVQSWDTIWNTKTSIQNDGWIAEVAIPFRSIGYEPGKDDWSINLVRTHRRTNELVRWSNIDRTKNNIDVSEIGTLSGMGENITKDRGLEAQIYGTAVASYDWETGQSETQTDPSANLYYRFTPALTGTLTFNTDFSDTPLDSRQVNTGRFSLFFPETRDFFLQDSAVFSVANRVFRSPNGRPFFSRRIGLVGGEPADLQAGAKLSGRIGETSIGALLTKTGDTSRYQGQTLGVLRATRPIFGDVQAGVIITAGDPTGQSNNFVTGIDFDYQKNNVGKLAGTVALAAVAIRSDNDGIIGNFLGGSASYRNDKWRLGFRFSDIDDKYDPALGFLSRRGIRRINPSIGRTWRPKDSIIDGISTGFYYSKSTDRQGTTFSDGFGGWGNISTKTGYRMGGGWNYGEEFIDTDFSLAGQIPVTAGIYDDRNISINLSTPENRKLSTEFGFGIAKTLGGNRNSYDTSVTWQPNQYLELGADYSYSKFDLPGGNLDIHIASANSVINMSAVMSVDTEWQYDNISQDFSWFSRFRWEPTPYREVFISFGHNAVIDPNRIGENFRSKGSSLSFRVGQTIRI